MSVRRLPPLLLALVLGPLAAFAAACGDEGDDRRLLRPQDAEAIRAELDKIDERVAQGECEDLAPAFVRLNRAIDELPQRTDADLRRRLTEGAEHLEQVSDEECEPAETTETQPETTETLPPETTETLPPETTETQPPETTETQPPETTPPPPETTPEVPVPPEDTGGEQAPGARFAPPGQAKKGDKG